jgi:large subunit ribosomal protein L35
MAKKQKTHKATSKRFKMTATGKLTHKRQGNNNHYMTKKSSGRKLRVEHDGGVDSIKQTKKLKQIGNY